MALSCANQGVVTYLARFSAVQPRGEVAAFLRRSTMPVWALLRKGAFQQPEQQVRRGGVGMPPAQRSVLWPGSLHVLAWNAVPDWHARLTLDQVGHHLCML